jgi:hypothetical protein
VRATVRFALVCAATLAVLGALFALLLRAPAARQAVLVSAVVAFAVQVAAFAAVRAAGRERLLPAWGAAGGVRLLTLIVYGLVAVRAYALPAEPALLSLATFLFVTTLIESKLISL